MSEERPHSSPRERSAGGRRANGSSDHPDTSDMRARRWVVAYHYREPADYGVPELPEWTVRRTECNGISLAEDDESEPFISADRPVRVRR